MADWNYCSKRAISNSLVNNPFESMLYNWDVVILSPLVLMIIYNWRKQN